MKIKTWALLRSQCSGGPWYRQNKCKSVMRTGTHIRVTSESFRDYDDVGDGDGGEEEVEDSL